MHGVIHVAAQIKNQVFAHNAHQVVADHADIIFGSIITDIGVDCGKTLSNGAASFQGSLVHQQHALSVAHPFFGLKGSAAGGHTAAHDQYINFPLFDFRVPHSLKLTCRFVR